MYFYTCTTILTVCKQGGQPQPAHGDNQRNVLQFQKHVQHTTVVTETFVVARLAFTPKNSKYSIHSCSKQQTTVCTQAHKHTSTQATCLRITRRARRRLPIEKATPLAKIADRSSKAQRCAYLARGVAHRTSEHTSNSSYGGCIVCGSVDCHTDPCAAVFDITPVTGGRQPVMV